MWRKVGVFVPKSGHFSGERARRRQAQAVRVRILIPATGARRRHGAHSGDPVPHCRRHPPHACRRHPPRDRQLPGPARPAVGLSVRLRAPPSRRPPDRAAVGAGRGDMQRVDAVRHEVPDRHRRHSGGMRRATRCGSRSHFCAAWWRRTICPGASAATRRIAPSSPSPATSGATCSAIWPATRRPISPNACRGRWPAGSPPPPTPRSRWRTPAPGTCCRRPSPWCCRSASSGRSTWRWPGH